MKKHYTLNKTYFSNINTPAKAYILGFIFGDGCITNKFHSTLAIYVKDLDILEYIKKELEYTGPIHTYDNHGTAKYSLRITNKILCRDLMSWGCTPNKAKTLRFPTNIKNKYIKYFITGLFDADGYVHIPTEDYKWKQYRKIGFSGTKHIIKNIKEYLETLGFSKTSLKLEKCGTYTTHYVTKHVELFNKKIYKHSPYRLKRKEKKFQDNEIVYSRLKDRKRSM